MADQWMPDSNNRDQLKGYGVQTGTASDGTKMGATAVSLAGSIKRFSYPLTASATDVAVPLPFTSSKVLIINDGTDTLNIAFDGTTSYGDNHPYNDPTWTATGAWTLTTIAGTPCEYAPYTATTSNLVCAPGVTGVSTIRLDLVSGTSAGIFKVELSKDGGATWVFPSTITGLTRSDGATSSGLNTVDEYSTNTVAYSLTYNLPYDTTTAWALRITPFNTKNASAGSSSNIFVAGAHFTRANVYTVKSGESLGLDIATTQFNYSTPTSTTGRVIAE